MSDKLRNEMQTVFHDVFGDDTILLEDSMTAEDIDGWDSMMHINLIVALEKRFQVRFATAEISGMKSEGQNVGTLLRLLADKMGAS